MAYYSGMQPTNRKESHPFRPTDNSPFSRHFTLADLLCICGYCSTEKGECKAPNEKRLSPATAFFHLAVVNGTVPQGQSLNILPLYGRDVVGGVGFHSHLCRTGERSSLFYVEFVVGDKHVVPHGVAVD